MINPSELSSCRKACVLCILFVVVVVLSLSSGLLLSQQSSLDAEMEVVSWSDPTDVHRVTQLRVRVTNEGNVPFSPAFNVIHGGLQTRNYWKIVSGPETLGPRESAVYTIQAQVPQYGIPFEKRAVLSVNAVGTERQTKLVLGQFRPGTPSSILNPALEHWRISPGEEFFRPYRWQVAVSDPDSTRVHVEERNGSAHVSVRSGSRSSGPWSMVGIQQRTNFPSKIHVEATPETLVESPSRSPKYASGVEVGESDHRVWVVFADVTRRTVVHRPGELEYVIVYVPATAGERVSTTVDVAAIYEEQGWEKPERAVRSIDNVEYPFRPVNVLAFAADYPSRDGRTVNVTYHEVNVTTDVADNSSIDRVSVGRTLVSQRFCWQRRNASPAISGLSS